jgi:hypothetical protein
MKLLLANMAIFLPLVGPAAPRLPPKHCFTSSEAKAYPVLIGPKETGKIEMHVTFTIAGKRDSTYTVELYVEVDSTGERAKLLRSSTVKLAGPAESDEGCIRGEFKLRNQFPGETDSPKQPYLPHPLSERYWSYQLVLKNGKDVVAVSGFAFVPFHRKDVRVPE